MAFVAPASSTTPATAPERSASSATRRASAAVLRVETARRSGSRPNAFSPGP